MGMGRRGWALALAVGGLRRGHRERVGASAVVSGADEGGDAGFLDEVVPEVDVLAAAVAHARTLATL